MKYESVAILDVRSNEVSFSLGTKGVNGTFIFNDSHSENHEGFLVDGFFDVASFRRAVATSVTSVRQNHGGALQEVYVGVPAPFVGLRTKGHTISFSKKRKITMQDIDALYESGLNELMESGRCIRRSAMYFSLGDNRKYFSAESLLGVSSTLLKGALCYYFVSDEFYETMTGLLGNLGFSKVHFIPSSLAQLTYLIPEKKREGYAFLLDVGFLTTTISVVYGNGIVREESFNCGIGTVVVALMQDLGIEYELAEEILYGSNISGGVVSKDEPFRTERGEEISTIEHINDVIKCALDVACEGVENVLNKYYKDNASTGLTVNPINVTGEGVGVIKGIAEHIASRLNRLTTVVCPDLPYYDKPYFSSRMALLATSTSDKKKKGFFHRIFNGHKGENK